MFADSGKKRPRLQDYLQCLALHSGIRALGQREFEVGWHFDRHLRIPGETIWLDTSQRLNRTTKPESKQHALGSVTPNALLLNNDLMRTALGFEKLRSQGIYYAGNRLRIMSELQTRQNSKTSCLGGNAMAMPVVTAVTFVTHGCLAALQEAERTGVIPFPLGQPTAPGVEVSEAVVSTVNPDGSPEKCVLAVPATPYSPGTPMSTQPGVPAPIF